MEKATFLALISGSVQGVGFRYYAYRQANSLNVNGYVRNLMDGRVEVAAEGDKPTLEAFLDQLKKGPMFSHVEHVNVKWSSFENKYKQFKIESGYGH